MCIAIFSPAGTEVSREVLKTCSINNPDGCGFGYADKLKGVIETFKSMDFEIFYKEYKSKINSFKDSPFLIHFRIRTSGTTDEFNCHPFKVTNQQCFIHNGIISRVKDDPEKKKNDTQMFNELVLQKLPKDWDSNSAIKFLLEDFIVGSKLCVLNANGSYSIINEAKGKWENGVWWSNDSYKPRVSYQSTYKNSQPYYNRTPSTHRSQNDPVVAIKEDIINKYNSRSPGAFSAFKSGMVVCDACGTEEPLSLSKRIMVEGVVYDACRECVKTFNSAGIFHYELYDDYELPTKLLPASTEKV